jgi:hypothetical protein
LRQKRLLSCACKLRKALQPADAKETKVAEEVTTYDVGDPFVSHCCGRKPKKDPPKITVSANKILGIVWNEKGNFATVVLPEAYTLRRYDYRDTRNPKDK